MRIKIAELQQQSGLTDAEFAKGIWPDANKDSRRVLLAKAKKGSTSIKLEQLKWLVDQFATSNIHNLIDFDHA